MKISKIIEQISLGEDSYHQFKEKVTDPKKIADEIIAFANTKGGTIFIGVNDSGKIVGLSPNDVEKTNQLIANAATNIIRPSINILSVNQKINDKTIIIITVREGLNKPYCNNSGAFWVKSGSDKRKITSPEELQRLFQTGKKVNADECLVDGTSIDDLDTYHFIDFFKQVYKKYPEETELPLDKLLENLNIMRHGLLNLAGLLLFGRDAFKFKPLFIIKGVSFLGNSIGITEYRDSEDIQGPLSYQYKNGMAFILRNLKKIQKKQSVNTTGILEVSDIALEELLQNAIIHRDYTKQAAIRLLVFDNRIEIISPGCLPNGLTVDQIKYGNSAIRNPIIAAHASKLMPFRGLGSGIIRAIQHQPDIMLQNDIKGYQFVATIPRPES
jgi:ATP-dependent DNA helicase RecG